MVKQHTVSANPQSVAVPVVLQRLDVKRGAGWKLGQQVNMLMDRLTVWSWNPENVLACPVVPDDLIHTLRISKYNKKRKRI
jgi:hypothetical protein